MTFKRLLGIMLSLMLIAISWVGLAQLKIGLVVRSMSHEGVPMVFMAPKAVRHRPGILIAHGFAGSKQLMFGYGYTLAHNGYGVLLLDFDGHGANAAPLDKGNLQNNFKTALAVLKRQPEIDPDKIGILGHSMGSRVVMVGGIEQAKAISAVVAISPTDAPVNPTKPQNLQLQAGEWEGKFVRQSAKLLQRAGGANPNTENGEGRSRIIVPQSEHILVLFKDRSHQAALKWFNSVFHQTSKESDYRDRRMAWYSLHLLSWLLLLAMVSPSIVRNLSRPSVRPRPLRSWLGLGIVPFSTAGIIYVMSLRTPLSNMGGMLVGGALGLWLFIAGLTWIGIISRFPKPTLKSMGYGLLLFGVLWMGFGAMAQETWLEWWLNSNRLKLWPVLACACFPWFLASGIVQLDTSIGKRILWWFAQSLSLTAGLIVTLILVPDLSFLALITPIIPIVLAILSFAAAQIKEAWSYAIASALFFGWTIASVFPLAV
ncbi:MAG: alpha/beta fold hydrolase [Acaryochloridaceae cyanobacterium RU_4_10]|nr:alpha/beta fold hydrolase [Acaryochloridaceae cyanobacterium RU_4_10]